MQFFFHLVCVCLCEHLRVHVNSDNKKTEETFLLILEEKQYIIFLKSFFKIFYTAVFLKYTFVLHEDSISFSKELLEKKKNKTSRQCGLFVTDT